MSIFESWDTRNYERTDEQKKPAIEVGAPPKNYPPKLSQNQKPELKEL